MKAIVCGGRDTTERAFIEKTLDSLGVSFVIQGGAPGVDWIARKWAEEKSIPCATVKAPWERLAASAGPIRNGWMLRLNPDVVVAFPGGRGTANMVSQAKAAGVRVLEPKP